MTSAPGAKSYGFDAQGRTTTETTPEGTTTFIYDSLDRITGRAPEGQPAQSFAYDALGRLTTTTQSGLTRTNNYALSDSPILETTAITGSFSSSRARSLSYGPTGLLESRIGAARPSYPVADEHGSLIGEISDLGKAGAARDYDPFGAELTPQEPADPSDPSAPLAEESLGYLGAHARPGVYGSEPIHMGARVYDPGAGRFLSRDSLPGIEADPQTQNPYAYGLNSPGRYYDLDGRRPMTQHEWERTVETIMKSCRGDARCIARASTLSKGVKDQGDSGDLFWGGYGIFAGCLAGGSAAAAFVAPSLVFPVVGEVSTGTTAVAGCVVGGAASVAVPGLEPTDPNPIPGRDPSPPRPKR